MLMDLLNGTGKLLKVPEGFPVFPNAEPALQGPVSSMYGSPVPIPTGMFTDAVVSPST
jgi:hypothetical protein